MKKIHISLQNQGSFGGTKRAIDHGRVGSEVWRTA